MFDIYEVIWNSPNSHVSVSRRDSSGNWLDPDVDILLDEQAKATGCASSEAAPRPLIASVNETLFEQPTFSTFIALLDNYTAREGDREASFADPVRSLEIEAFLDAVFDAEPMQMAFDYVRSELDSSTTIDQFREQVRRMWFEPYTNRFSSATDHCVGFEHVFVGEDESKAGSPPSRCSDSVGGYHSWIKYYLDWKAGKVSYLGHDYKSDVDDEGLAEPTVATVVITWKPEVEDGGNGHELLKKPGGFFVGTRPECEIALGSVGLLDTLAGRFKSGPSNAEGHRRVRFGNSFFDFVVHPQTIRRSPREIGPRIRTMYPKFRGSQVSPEPNNGEFISVPTQPHNNGPIKLVRAMPNPPGTTDEGEWVELSNVTDEAIALDSWLLSDRNKRTHSLSGTLAPGETLREQTRTSDPSSMQLTNSGGWILLYEDRQRRAAVNYGRADQGEVMDFS